MGQVISIGKQDYVSLRENHYFYIDKTALMYQMVKLLLNLVLVTKLVTYLSVLTKLLKLTVTGVLP